MYRLSALAVVILVWTLPIGAVSYVESSSGLVPPTMDGGRTEIEMADMNLDGNIDLVSIGDHGSPYVNTDQHGIMVWFGDGTGSWSVFMNGNFGYGGVAVGDVNNDGMPDVGYAMHHNYSSVDFGDQLIEVALGDGTGMNWIPWDDGLATNGEDWGMFGIDFADYDNDGDLDLGSVSFGCCAGVHLYRNEGDGTWTQTFGFCGGNSRMIFTFGDVNNDGNADFAVSQEDGTVYLGDGQGNFVLADANLPPSGSLGRAGVDLGDADNDGGDDLAFINSNHGVEVWVFEDDSTWTDFSGALPSTGDYEAAQLFDMNLDGFVDVMAFGEGTFTLWLGDGAGNWTLETTFSTPSPGGFQAFRVGADADHNGYPDIALVDEEGSWPSYQNHLRFYKEVSTPESLFIFPVSPRGGQTFRGGAVGFIRWTAAVQQPGTARVRLEFSSEGSDGPFTLVAEDLPENNSYQWTLPLVRSDSCYIRYTLTAGADTAMGLTPRPFSILYDLCGDTDGNGHVTPADGYVTLNYFGAGPQPVSCWSANVNGDDALAPSDGYHLLNFLGSGAPLNCAECEF